MGSPTVGLGHNLAQKGITSTKETLNGASEKLETLLKPAEDTTHFSGKSQEKKGYWQKVKNFFTSIYDSIKNFFSKLFGKKSSEKAAKQTETNAPENTAKQTETKAETSKSKTASEAETSSQAEPAHASAVPQEGKSASSKAQPDNQEATSAKPPAKKSAPKKNTRKPSSYYPNKAELLAAGLLASRELSNLAASRSGKPFGQFVADSVTWGNVAHVGQGTVQAVQSAGQRAAQAGQEVIANLPGDPSSLVRTAGNAFGEGAVMNASRHSLEGLKSQGAGPYASELPEFVQNVLDKPRGIVVHVANTALGSIPEQVARSTWWDSAGNLAQRAKGLFYDNSKAAVGEEANRLAARQQSRSTLTTPPPATSKMAKLPTFSKPESQGLKNETLPLDEASDDVFYDAPELQKPHY